jgi:hypothetical protein
MKSGERREYFSERDHREGMSAAGSLPGLGRRKCIRELIWGTKYPDT